MKMFRQIFQKKHVFLAVIHVEGGAQALRNAQIAKNNGADGIFLINHSISYISLIECYTHIKMHLPHFWIGLNCLDLGMEAVKVLPKNTAGLWVDNAHTDEPKISRSFSEMRKMSGWKGLYFGGVAFKYQKAVSDVAKAAKKAVPYVDVITTSGDATGIAPKVEKIRAMKNTIGDHPLAIASGITTENVGEYKPFADCFLVATHISASPTELDPRLVKKLSREIHS
jgi:uncharacterized protein